MPGWTITLAVGLTASLLGACMTAGEQAVTPVSSERKIDEAAAQTAGSLAETSWRLVHFQPSDTAKVPIPAPRGENYLLKFMADGTLAFRLDCRATARWEARPSSATGGALTLLPGPMTRAMCRQGVSDVSVARDLVRVRSYTLVDGRLSLAMEPGAGSYVWEPVSK